MPTNAYQQSYLNFISRLNAMRPEHHKWAAIVLKSMSNDNNESIVGEMLQVMEFHYNGQETIMLSSIETKRVFVIIKNEKECALTILESSIVQEFSTPDVKIELGAPLHKCVDRLCEIIKDCIPENDIKTIVALKKFARLTKVFILYTQNNAMRQKMIQMLQYFGNVFACTNQEDFLRAYEQYAPNTVFIDAEILKEPKEQIFETIKRMIDADPSMIVMSDNTERDYIISCLKGGANGFLVYPPSFESLFTQLKRCNIFAKI